MKNLTWGEFLEKHKERTSFSVDVPENMLGDMISDYNDLELPSPYELFIKWCSSYLSSDWVTKTTSRGFILCVSDGKDTLLIKETFSISGPDKVTIAGKNTSPIDYTFKQYSALAGDLGYVLKNA